MQTSTIAVAMSINASRTLHTGDYYPFSAQYKGGGWQVFDASLNAWGGREYPTARLADEAARAAYQAKHGIFADAS